MPKEQDEKIELNDQQKSVVQYQTGPLLVVAGAGTGKTRVITQRIKHLMEKKKADSQEILALTFTEKASTEILNRVGDVLPLGYEEPWVYTFHSFTDRLLRNEGIEFGINPAYKILSSSEQWLFLRQHLFDFDLDYFRPLGNPSKFISAILRFISRCQDESISSTEFLEFAKSFDGDKEEKERWMELAHVYQRYEELKLESSKMDFGDLITWAVRLFEERPNVLKKYQDQFKHVLVDEFQDTNYVQYELVKLLCPKTNLKERSLLVVGDDSQSIYKFRGAAVSNILEFQKDYPDAKMITLLQNYRSSQAILDPAYKLIKNNNPDTLESKLGISKKLVSKVSKGDEKPQVLFMETLEDEVDVVISKILEILVQEPLYTYKDIAILARANSHLDHFVMALKKRGLPYQLVGNRGLYDRNEVRDVLALLRITVSPNDAISLYRALNIESLKISGYTISDLLSKSKYKKQNLWEVVKNRVDQQSEEDSLLNFYEIITNFQSKITDMTPSEFVYKLVSQINYLKPYLENESIESQLSIKNLNLFLDIVKRFEVDYRKENKETPTIVDFIDYLDLMLEAGESPAQAEIEDIDTINLLTVHSSKGLEFNAVFLVNLVSDRFPTRDRKDPIEIPESMIKELLPSGNVHIQEERRLFYVGMTRARKYLYLTGAKNYGGKREKAPSGFINETGIEVSSEEPEKKVVRQTGLFGVETGFRDSKITKIKNFVPRFLSYSQINKYKTCPLQYKYSYVLGIPTPPNHALSFGITIHNTLRDFHEALMFEKISLKELYKMYENNWQPLGYSDEKHRLIRYESGKKLLEEYWKQNKDSRIKPKVLEKSFNVRIAGIKFFGKIDRIDPVSDGGVEIIDYKTGRAKDQKFVDSDDQVAFYAIGASEALGLEPKKLTYYYVETGERISTTRTKAQLDDKKREVADVIKKMEKGVFEATPGMCCRWCDFKDICPKAWKG